MNSETDDLIHNPAAMPSFDAIAGSIAEPARALWLDLHAHLQGEYHSAPKTAFSICAGKPGWNMKYQKSGKALCTLYPEPERFTALVVVPERMQPLIAAPESGLPASIRALAQAVGPFNHTLWLMIPVGDRETLEGVKDLLALKRSFTAAQPAGGRR